MSVFSSFSAANTTFVTCCSSCGNLKTFFTYGNTTLCSDCLIQQSSNQPHPTTGDLRPKVNVKQEPIENDPEDDGDQTEDENTNKPFTTFICRECKQEKDNGDRYKSTGKVCKKCKSNESNNKMKTVRTKNIELHSNLLTHINEEARLEKENEELKNQNKELALENTRIKKLADYWMSIRDELQNKALELDTKNIYLEAENKELKKQNEETAQQLSLFNQLVEETIQVTELPVLPAITLETVSCQNKRYDMRKRKPQEELQVKNVKEGKRSSQQ
jgi:hypothetical protein